MVLEAKSNHLMADGAFKSNVSSRNLADKGNQINSFHDLIYIFLL